MPEEKSKEILIGATEREIVSVALHVKPDGEISLTGHEYDRTFFDAVEGETQARESLEGSGLWEEAVKSKRTTASETDYYDEVIDVDGWEEIIGDLAYLPNNMYTRLTGTGQIDVSTKAEDIIKPAIDPQDIKTIWQVWKKYHLKKPPRSKLLEIESIFNKYKKFDVEQLENYGEEEVRLKA